MTSVHSAPSVFRVVAARVELGWDGVGSELETVGETDEELFVSATGLTDGGGLSVSTTRVSAVARFIGSWAIRTLDLTAARPTPGLVFPL